MNLNYSVQNENHWLRVTNEHLKLVLLKDQILNFIYLELNFNV